MNNFDNKIDNLCELYNISDNEEKKVNWNLAIGLQKIDGIKPSLYLEKLIELYGLDKIKMNTLVKFIEDYYEEKVIKTNDQKREKECDLVSSRIAMLVTDNNFEFSIDYLKYVHSYLFKDIYNFAGIVRKCNLTKIEPVIDFKSVKYADYNEIDELLTLAFNNEKNRNQKDIFSYKNIQEFADFMSNIWQIHPFCEGNTRTTAIFVIKYLKSLGFNINLNLFLENSSYFRDSLVLSTCENSSDSINNKEYLYEFYRMLFENSERNVKKLTK